MAAQALFSNFLNQTPTFAWLRQLDRLDGYGRQAGLSMP